MFYGTLLPTYQLPVALAIRVAMWDPQCCPPRRRLGTRTLLRSPITGSVIEFSIRWFFMMLYILLHVFNMILRTCIFLVCQIRLIIKALFSFTRASSGLTFPISHDWIDKLANACSESSKNSTRALNLSKSVFSCTSRWFNKAANERRSVRFIKIAPFALSKLTYTRRTFK